MDNNSDAPFDSDEDDEDFGRRLLATAEADEIPVPAIETLSVSGLPCPAEVLVATAFTSGPTQRCEFAWLRGLGNDSWTFISGENKDTYLVTADDVDCYLAVEAIPIGTCDQMGEVVRTHVNKHQKITCGSEMQDEIEKAFFTGHASFAVSVLCQNNIWKNADLGFNSTSFSITQSHRKYAHGNLSPNMAIIILNGHCSGLVIQAGNNSHTLTTETSWLRDVIVLTMRAFVRRAIEKGKVQKKKRFLFF